MAKSNTRNMSSRSRESDEGGKGDLQDENQEPSQDANPTLAQKDQAESLSQKGPVQMN